MTQYSYAELEGLWISAGGPKNLAPTMAAIAEAESGGNSDAHNPSGASGLWQILGNPFPGNPFDPATNAKMAVAKWKSQGLGAWVTYTSGAYKAFLSNKTTPAPAGSVAGSPTAQTTAAIFPTGGSSTCAWSVGLNIPIPFTSGVGNVCLLSKQQLREIVGVGLMLSGSGIMLAGLVVLAAVAGMKALGPAGKVAEGVGGALLLVPGAEGAGMAIAGAGRQAQQSPRQRYTFRQKAAAANERSLGEPRENPDMEVRGGAVRQTSRQRAAQRSRERRAAGGGEPPF